jgi:serine/threonine-protein kinase
MDDKDKLSIYMEDCRRLGMKVLPPDVNHGQVEFEVEDGAIWLTDFGIAKIVGEQGADEATEVELTQAGAQMGTPLFMSPEQLEDSKDVDARADVYALGVMLFAALARRVPFEGTIGAIATKQARVAMGKEPLPRPRALAPDVPEALDALCARAIALDRAARLPDAGAFVLNLSHAPSNWSRSIGARCCAGGR